MSKKIFQLVNPHSELIRPSSMSKETLETNWESCFFCQETTSEVLECPARKSTHLDKGSGYKSIAEQLKRFQGIGELPSFLDTRTGLTSNEVLAGNLLQNEAKFHKRCKNKYDDYHYQRVCRKRKKQTADVEIAQAPPSTRQRYSADNFKVRCFFCEKDDLEVNLTNAQTLGLDKNVRDAAKELFDEKLLAKLSEGDMVAVEARYHKQCLAALYNRLKSFH